jgi:uncharacterized protein YkwD
VASSRTAVPLIVLLFALLLTGCGSSTGANWAANGTGASDSAAASGQPDPSMSDAGTDPSVAASPSPTRTVAPSTAPKPPGPPPVPGSSPAAQAVLAQINGWRTAMGLRPYTMLPGLIASAHKHNLVMIAGCGLSHRCPGEADLGDRIRAQGVRWSAAGENIGESGPNANTTTAITNAAKGLDQAMFNEKPPDDGHRQNLLSRTFTHIGIDVVRDSKGTVWLTEDFTN